MVQAAHDIEKLDIEELSEYNRYFKDAEKDFEIDELISCKGVNREDE